MAGNLLMSISQDERERAVFRSRRMYQSDMDSNMATVRDRAIQERNIEIARKLLKIGDSVDKIIAVTDLTPDEVESLRPH